MRSMQTTIVDVLLVACGTSVQDIDGHDETLRDNLRRLYEAQS